MEGDVVQPVHIANETRTRQTQMVFANNADRDILIHPHLVVDSLLICLIIFITKIMVTERPVFVPG